jgi:hypothetical protein
VPPGFVVPPSGVVAQPHPGSPGPVYALPGAPHPQPPHARPMPPPAQAEEEDEFAQLARRHQPAPALPLDLLLAPITPPSGAPIPASAAAHPSVGPAQPAYHQPLMQPPPNAGPFGPAGPAAPPASFSPYPVGPGPVQIGSPSPLAANNPFAMPGITDVPAVSSPQRAPSSPGVPPAHSSPSPAGGYAPPAGQPQPQPGILPAYSPFVKPAPRDPFS